MRALLLVVLAIACGQAPPPPLPRVVTTSPAGAVAPDAVVVEIAFSGAIDRAGVEDGRWFALCRREDLRDVLSAIESEPGVTAGARVVAATVELADGGRRAVLRPQAPLEPERAWVAVLSHRVRSFDGRPVLDSEGKPRSVAIPFDTGPAVDRSAPNPRWILPPHGPVPANVAALRVGFDEPVTGEITVTAPVPVRTVPAGPDLLELRPSGALPPGLLALDLRNVRDVAGNEAAPLEPLAVSACAVVAPPALTGEMRATPARLAVTVQGSVGGMGRLVAEVTTRDGDPACGTVPAAPATLSVRGEIEACPGWDPCTPQAVACGAAVALTGLCPGQALRVRIAAEDLAGHRGALGPVIEAAALPPRPEPVVTEILADADPPESGGEYVEVANLGTGDLDLAGYSIAKRTASGKLVRCVVTASGSTAVGPGAHALVVGGAYDARYDLPAGTAVYRCGSTALDGGLANGSPVAVALQDPAGTTVSSAGLAEPVERCAGGALERVHPAGPDAASNWSCPGTRSPGTCNAATPAAECPRRPW